MNSTQPQRKDGKNVPTHGTVGISKDYLDHGDPTFPCESCGALLWHAETRRRATNALDRSYSICCSRGKVKLGTKLEPPQLLKDLITNEHHKSASFIDNIRRYNSMFAFISMGGKVDDTVNYGRGPFCYRIHGENYHRVGSLLPETVSIAGTTSTEQSHLKDKSMWSDQEKRIQKIDRLARSHLIQGLSNDIYSLIDSNKTAKDLWDALAVTPPKMRVAAEYCTGALLHNMTATDT
nr:hypothetical protein [Tanacetum cinerariifolium]